MQRPAFFRPRLRRCVLWAVSWPALAAGEPAPPAPQPEPPAAEVKTAEAAVRERYKAELARKSQADRADLAADLLKAADKAVAKPAERYVLFRLARDVAAQAGDAPLAVRAADGLARAFAVDPLPAKAVAIDKAAQAATTPAAAYAVADEALDVVDAALLASDFDTAFRLALTAKAAASRAKSPTLVRRTEARLRDVREVQRDVPKVEQAVDKLTGSPKDPGASLEVGRFRCLLVNNWAAGLSFLADGSDARLKALAEADLKEPAEAAARAGLADAYWKLADAERGAVADGLRRRAGHWYLLALPGLTGADAERARKRSVDFLSLAPAAEVLETKASPKGRDFIRLNRNEAAFTKRAVTGPFEWTLLARTEEQNIRLRGPRGSAVIFNWEVAPDELRVHRPDGKARKVESGSIAPAPFKALTPGTWYLLSWRVTAERIEVWVDGKRIFTETGRYDVSAREPVSVAACAHVVDVKAAKIVTAR